MQNMTNEEWSDFAAFMRQSLPAYASWVKNNISAGDLEGFRQSLRRRFNGISLEAGREAVNIVADDLSLLPRSSGNIPAAVATLARKRQGYRRQEREARKRQYHDREQAYKCLRCRDDGIITVWHSFSVAVARGGIKAGDRTLTLEEHDAGRATRYSMVVACTCPEGENWRHLARFDIDQHLPIVGWMSDPEEQQKLLAFVRPKRHEEFAGFE